VAEKQGVKFEFNSMVSGVEIQNKEITHLVVNGAKRSCVAVIAGADYHHVEQHILPPEARSYSEKYWNNRTMSPSSLLFYIGLDKEIPELQHHNLFFDADFSQHAVEIYDTQEWPNKPLFYACCPSKTDNTVAPKGKENLFLLIPVAPGLQEEEGTRDHYYNLIMDRLEKHVGMEVRKHVIYKRSYAHKEFIEDYGAFKGNAYGLANTLTQTAFLKPKLKSKKLHNLYFAGQLTTPGPGVPPCLISGQVAAKEVNNMMSKRVISLI
jgi:phytoene desaturase